MSADRPALGILMMLGFIAFIPFSDALGKMMGGIIPILQLILVRFLAQVILLVPYALIAGLSFRMTPRVFALTGLRAILQIFGIGMMFTSLLYLPLADAIAIAFVMPFLMLILGHYVLGEEVGIHRIMACAVGFVGTLMVIQPSFVEVGWVALLPLSVAVIFALFMLITRQIAKEADPIVLQGVGSLIGTPILLVVLALPLTSFNMGWVWPDDYHVMLLVIFGTVGTIAHLLMTWSLKFAPSATLAPMQYLEIPMAALMGWLFFREFPNGLALAGIAVTMSAGFYIVFRENSAGARARAAGPAP